MIHLSGNSKTKTIALNRYYWKVDTLKSGRINLRKHSHIIRNGQGDAVLALDLSPARNEVHQYKNVKKANFNLEAGRRNATDTNDFCLILNKLDPKHEERWQVSSATELYSCGEGKLGYVFRSLRSESLLLVCGVALRSDSGSRGWVCFIDVSAHI